VVATPVQRHVEREGQKPHGADSLPGCLLLQAWAVGRPRQHITLQSASIASALRRADELIE